MESNCHEFSEYMTAQQQSAGFTEQNSTRNSKHSMKNSVMVLQINDEDGSIG